MQARNVTFVEKLAGVKEVAGIVAKTRLHLSSSGSRLYDQLADNLLAYHATIDVLPYFGDNLLAYTEASFQLHNAVSLAFHGFYSHAFSTLRSVCELSLLQSSLPEDTAPPGTEVNLVWIVGQRALLAGQTSEEWASSLKSWAVDGCKIPGRQMMLQILLNSDKARRFNAETHLGARLEEFIKSLHQYVHERGFLRSACGLAMGSMLRFSEKSLSLFADNMRCATQLSVSMLLLAFLPTATTEEGAAVGFIDTNQLAQVLRILPRRDAELLLAMSELPRTDTEILLSRCKDGNGSKK